MVDAGGFTRAAASLGVSQPAISKSINDLERQLHLALLERTSRSIALTEAGRTLYDRATELFGVERVAERELRELRGNKRGTLRIAASATIATYLLPPVLGRYHRRHPDARIIVRKARSDTVRKLLLDCRVDVALVEQSVDDPTLEAIPWQVDRMVVVAHPEHPLRARQGLRAADLEGETWLVGSRGTAARGLAERALAERGVRLARTMRVDGIEAIKHAVAAGLGIAIVSRAAAEDQLALDRIAVLPVVDLDVRRTLTQLRRRGRTPPPAAREFQALLDDARSAPAPGASGDAGEARDAGRA